MTESEGTEPEATPVTPATVAAQFENKQKSKLFSAEQQAEVDRIVADRVKRIEARYADYDELKRKGEQASDLEGRVSTLQEEIGRVQLDSMRIRIAAQFGLPDEDRDTLLTATDEAGLVMQAERLAQRIRPTGNVARREGQTVMQASGGDRELREFVGSLFGNDSIWD